MFTGLIEEVAVLERMEMTPQGARLHLRARQVLQDVRLGDSIAVSGVCLTVVKFTNQQFSVEAVPETLRRSTLGQLKPGDGVNVERALRVGDRFGGHIVSGHVDGMGEIARVEQEGIARILTVSADPSVMRYVVEKGSICLDGVSLTVMDLASNQQAFRVSIIPHTAGHTTLEHARIGQVVNLECDVVAKYVERLAAGYLPGLQRDNGNAAVLREQGDRPAAGISLSMLAENGFA